MLKDAARLEAGTTIDADVCIVGSGPAGQTLARELAGTEHKVVVLESGDFRRRRKLKQLNEGETFGDAYHNPRWGRERRVGGSTNRWLTDIGGGTIGARFVPLDPIDFEKRDRIPHSGWPISRSDLDPFYERAQVHCGAGPFRYDVEAWKEPGLSGTIETPGIETTMFQFGPQTQWTVRAHELFSKSPNIDTYLNASVVELETNAAGDFVTTVKALNPARQPLQVRAKFVVLAVGCVETTRVLLNSKAVHKEGIGNAHGVLGRYYMDHPQSYMNAFKPRDRRLFDTLGLFDLRLKGKMSVMAKLTFRDELLRREQIPNVCHVLFPRRDHFLTPGFQAFFSLALDVKRAARPVNVGKRLKSLALGASDLLPIAGWFLQGKAHYPHLAKGGWAHLADKRDLFTAFEVWTMVEQLPHAENRVRLSDKRDPNGTPIVRIDWRFTEADHKAVQRQRSLFKQEIEAAGLGEMTWSKDVYSTPSSVHPIGGARMGMDPRSSVVNEHLAVHGVPNLLLASSAVFPTAGYANPTLTVVALACRVADRLKSLLAARPGITVARAPSFASAPITASPF
ncbi:MAG: GMC family oxidoreductase [Hyphomicrobiaceae bacterium]